MRQQSLVTRLSAVAVVALLAACNAPERENSQLFLEDDEFGAGAEFDESNLDPGESLLTANLSGDFLVAEPDVVTDATGSGSFVVDENTGAIDGVVIVEGLTSDVVDVDIRAGGLGEVGPVVLELVEDPDVGGIRFRLPRNSDLSATETARLLAGEFHVRVATAANPGGELRGQLLTGVFELVALDLRGENVVPPEDTLAVGRGSVLIDRLDQTVDVNVRLFDITNDVAAHVHLGFAGIGDAVGQDIVFFLDNTAPEFWETQTPEVLTDAEFQNLTAGAFYVDVHTASDPDGALRAQIAPDDIRVVRTELGGGGAPFPADPEGRGVGYTTLDIESGRITVNLNTDNLSSAATAAHIHRTPVSETAETIMTLEQNPLRPSQWRSRANSLLTRSATDSLLDGELYLDVHTQDNPNGEIVGVIQP